MKRSKIILGMTTGILAIAAVAVAKKNTKVGFYCTQPLHAGQCLQFTPKVDYLQSGLKVATVGNPYKGVTVYTAGITSTGTPDCSNANNCTNIFRYSFTNPN